MRIITTLLLFAIFTSTCRNPYQAEIQKIDSMLLRLDTVRVTLNQIDTALINKRIKKIDEVLKKVMADYDTVDRERAFLIDDYYNIRKYYSKGLSRLSVFYDEIEVIPAQLKNLKTDLSKNLIETDKASLYLLNEEMAVEGIYSGITGLASRFETLHRDFEKTDKKILLLIQTPENTTNKDPEF